MDHPDNSAMHQTHSFVEHEREVQHDVRALMTALQDSAEDARRYVSSELKRQPYRTLAVAAGAGYVVGGGLSVRMTRVLIGMGTRFAMAVAARQLLLWIDESRASSRP